MLAPLMVCCLHDVEFFGSERAGLFEDAVVDADFADVVQQRRDFQFVEVIGRQAQFLRNQSGIFRNAAGVTASVRILFVDGRGKHADGAEEQLAIFLGGFFQALDVLLDVAGHHVEVFGQLADFRGAAHRRALVKFAAADGARGRGKAANRFADADGKEVTETERPPARPR